MTDALRKRDKGKRKKYNNNSLNNAHQQEIKQLKQEKEQMNLEIQRLRHQLQQMSGGNNYGTTTIMNSWQLDLTFDCVSSIRFHILFLLTMYI